MFKQKTLVKTILIGGLASGFYSSAWAAQVPAKSCDAAKALTAETIPANLTGQLDSSVTPDVNFFKVTGTPGSTVKIDLKRGTDVPLDPYLGVFDSSCVLTNKNDDFNGSDSRLIVTIPTDGILIIGATRYGDPEFVGGGDGAYTLTLTPTTVLSSISGTIINATTLQPIESAYADLYACNPTECNFVTSQIAGADGKVKWSQDYWGTPLEVGNYKVVATNDQYEPTETAQFAATKNQDKDVGDIALTSYPARLSIKPCADVPSTGGACKFSMTVANGQAKTITATAWNIVTGYSINALSQSTQFSVPYQILLLPKAGAKGSTKTLNFQFKVPAGVRDGASICVTPYVGGLASEPGFNLKGTTYGFCLQKGTGSSAPLKLMPADKTEKLQQQLSKPLLGK